MAVNFLDTWDGEKLSDVRAFIQKQLQNGFVNISSSTLNGKVVLTLTKADGTILKVEFTAAEDEASSGYKCDFRMQKKQSVYGSGAAITFSYTLSQTDSGEDVIGIAPTITFTAYTTDSLLNPVKLLWTTTIVDASQNKSVTIPATTFENVSGAILIKGTCEVNYQGQEVSISRLITINIATCEIDFGSSFDLSKQVRGYATNGTLSEVFVDYVGTEDGELLLYVDGVLRSTFEATSGLTTEINYDLSDAGLNGEGALSTGLHCALIIAKMLAGTDIDTGDPIYIYSKSLLFDFYKGLTNNHVGIKMNIDSSDVIEDPIKSLTLNTQQYVTSVIEYAASAYDSSSKDYKELTTVGISKDTTNVSNLAVGSKETFKYSFRDTAISKYVLTFSVIAQSRIINIAVVKNSSGVSVASGAAIDISAAGRNNLENTSTIDVWEFSDNSGKTYTGTLTNFLHTVDDVDIDGWDGESLKFRGSSLLDLPYTPFGSFNKNTGYYIEFNIKVDTVLDEDLYILSCLNSDNKGGFYLKAEEAGIITTNGTTVFTPIAAGNNYNISFMIKSYTGTDNGSTVTTILLELFVNGIRSAVETFSTSDSFDSTATITMNGLGAIWYFYGMRVYNSTLTPLAIYNNYLTTLLDSDLIVSLADENDILNTAKNAVSFDKLISKGKNVLVVETGDGDEKCVLDSADSLGKVVDDSWSGTPLETLTITTKTLFLNPSSKKKANFLVKSLTYYHNGKLTDDRSFKCGPTLMQVQGTSSTYYSRKNYDIFFTGLKYDKSNSVAKWTSYFDPSVGSDAAIQNRNTTNPLYSMGTNDQGVPCLCLKADYSDSSSLHNTVVTKLINDVWFGLGSKYRTPPQYNNDSEYPEVRVGIDGHPIDVFVKDENGDYTYIGKYNMNNEKKDSHHVFGFTGTVGNTGVGSAICIEFLENNRTATLFNADSSFNWTTCSDTDDESGEAIPQLEFRYPSYDWADAPDNLRSAAKRPFLWVKKCYDSWKASYSEATGQYTDSTFVLELTLYFNPYNLCAWYLYTDYFMAVDQRSKNMMLASWGATADSGIWYFLPYDSDTILAVTNDGWLVLPWDSDENTKNPKDSTLYAFMGHDSNLWELVRFFLYDDTYTSNSEYGLEGCNLQTVALTLRDETSGNTLFNLKTINARFAESRDYWSDMIFNFDADTKYIEPLTYQTGRGSKSDFALFVQGARDAHRDWLIDKRFRLLDSKYAAGYFVSDEKNMKLSKELGVAASMKVTAATTAYVLLIANTTTVAKKKLEAGVETELDITNFALGSNDPFKLLGFSAAESIDFNTVSDYIYSDILFPSTYTKLKTLKINATDNTALSTNIGDIVKPLTNLRTLELSGLSNATGTLDLSNNIMLESVTVDCSKLLGIIMPYSYLNIKKFNVGNLNEFVPWKFWDELNDYYYKLRGSCIFVAELVDSDATYGLYNYNSTATYYCLGKYVFYEFPYPSIGGHLDRGDHGYFGGTTSTHTRNPANIKKILYAKVDTRLYNVSASTPCLMYYFLSNCTNLEYINTKGFRIYAEDFTNLLTSTAVEGGILSCYSLKSIDLSFFKTGYNKNKQNYWVFPKEALTRTIYVLHLSNLTYIKYGSGWFEQTVQNLGASYIFAFTTQMNALHYIDLAEDIPDISNLDINSDYKILSIGSNYNDATKFPDAIKEKIQNKGWNVIQ